LMKSLEEPVASSQREDPDPPEADAVAPQGAEVHGDTLANHPKQPGYFVSAGGGSGIRSSLFFTISLDLPEGPFIMCSRAGGGNHRMGVTQLQIAKRVGLHVSSVCKILNRAPGQVFHKK